MAGAGAQDWAVLEDAVSPEPVEVVAALRPVHDAADGAVPHLGGCDCSRGSCPPSAVLYLTVGLAQVPEEALTHVAVGAVLAVES